MNVEPGIATPLAAKSIDSYLLIHVDSDLSHAIFVRDIAGRLSIIGAGVAHSTHEPPEANIHLGVAEAVQQIEEQTGHHMITPEGELVRNTRSTHAGIEQVLLTAATFKPWPILVIAPTENDPALASVNRLLTSFANQPPMIWTAENRLPLEEQVNRFLNNRPTIVIIVGEKDRKNVRGHFAEAIMWGNRLLADNVRPPIIYAGSPNGLTEIEQSLGGETILHVAEDIRPHARRERLNPVRQLLADLVRESHISQIPSMPDLIRWSLTQPQLDMLMAARYLDYRVRETNKTSLAVWVVRDSIWLIYATPDGLHKHIYSTVGLQMGSPGQGPLIDVGEALEWIAETDSEEHRGRLIEQLANQAIWEDTIPEQPFDYALWTAGIRQLLREAIREAMAGWEVSGAKSGSLPIDELIIGGTILRMVFPLHQLLEVILDGLQPSGIFQVLADRFAVLSALGLLAEHNPQAASDIHASRPLENLAVCICSVHNGRKAVTLNWQAADGEHQRVFNGDELQMVELAPADGNGIAVKSGRRGGIPGVRGRNGQVEGGDEPFLRLVVDTRGRPIKLSSDPKKRQMALLRWQAGMREST